MKIVYKYIPKEYEPNPIRMWAAFSLMDLDTIIYLYRKNLLLNRKPLKTYWIDE